MCGHWVFQEWRSGFRRLNIVVQLDSRLKLDSLVKLDSRVKLDSLVRPQGWLDGTVATAVGLVLE